MYAEGMDGSVVGVKTLVETPAALFAGGAELNDRTRIRLTNLSASTRMRVGRLASNLQRDGDVIEPGDSALYFPSTTIYGCSEGAAITCQIEEK